MSAFYVDRLLADNGLIELRCLGPSTLSGFFDDPDALRFAAKSVNATHQIFTSLNRPTDRPATNQLASGGRCLANSDVESITRIPFDFDPVRPTGTNSTAAELEAARVRAYGLLSFLKSWHWPEPLVACSGNGWHLQYRVKLPADDTTRDAMATLYKALESRFSDDAVHFDPVVRNPARIFRLYGSLNIKGPHTDDRPQRMASCYLPSEWGCVSRRQFRTTVESMAAPPVSAPTPPRQASTGRSDYRSLNVVPWFQSLGRYVGPLGEGMHGVICPWASLHTSKSPANGSDCVIWESQVNRNGWPGFHCKHSHCDGRSLLDAIRLYGNAEAFCTVTLTPGHSTCGRGAL